MGTLKASDMPASSAEFFDGVKDKFDKMNIGGAAQEIKSAISDEIAMATKKLSAVTKRVETLVNEYPLASVAVAACLGAAVFYAGSKLVSAAASPLRDAADRATA